MKCPDCGQPNIPGSDNCESCGIDLSAVRREPSGMQKKIIEGTLKDMRPRPAVLVPPDKPIPEVVALMREKKSGCVLVSENGAIVGMMTERDLLFGVAGIVAPEDAVLAELMHKDPVCLKEDDPVSFAFHHMSVGGFRHLPVLREDGSIGMVSSRDLLRFLSAAN